MTALGRSTMPDHLADAIRHHTSQLSDNGYTIVENALPDAMIRSLHDELNGTFERTPFGTGLFYGETTKRFGRLLLRSGKTQALVLHPLVLAIVEAVLGRWCDRIQLNTTQAISVHPGAGEQYPHRDQDMWRADFGIREYLVNVMWPLTPFSAHNGGTRIWPGSHGACANEPAPDGASVVPDLAPGAALLFLGSTLHGAGANRSDAERRGIVIGYSLGWLRAYENQSLAYPPVIAKRFPPRLAELVGYVQHRPNLGNFEGQCPSILLGGYKGEPLGAIDALRPDQMEAARAYVGQQGASS
jgi:hypothetical protein